jgi:hypothetical protein
MVSELFQAHALLSLGPEPTSQFFLWFTTTIQTVFSQFFPRNLPLPTELIL